jgi:hypothetical protein
MLSSKKNTKLFESRKDEVGNLQHVLIMRT